MSDWGNVLERAESLLHRLESYLPERTNLAIDWKKVFASRWRFYNERGFLQAVEISDPIHVRDLSAIDDQIKLVEMNTRQFIAGLPSNCLLYTSPSPRDMRRSRMPSSA